MVRPYATAGGQSEDREMVSLVSRLIGGHSLCQTPSLGPDGLLGADCLVTVGRGRSCRFIDRLMLR
jgi:hypothetical protein